ncbi:MULTISPECIES: ligase-associated DNA damage response DEXH box helicase [Rhodomicrobium]|uniref:ligase-associated DNA damage response DEXH box helicase n=1 Tax=Rhodomicrobium TaxID=1068 RepID=UPI000B4B01EF|nr:MULTISPECIES: ligase-associated DNA damage response DEXH box helicase [Rhodomicrobium]
MDKVLTRARANAVPDYVERWFAGKGWELRDYQRKMVEAFGKRRSTLLVAPTGGGKTLSGFLPSLIDIHETRAKGLHTLYISPLKALANDIERNLHRPIEEMGLSVTVESRTGDTPAGKRKRQRERPPNILLTTPESIMLMLSFPDARKLFANVRSVIVDEVHSFAPTKRGDFTALALARLAEFAPDHIRFGLSATAAHPENLAAWLGFAGRPATLLKAGLNAKPNIRIMRARKVMPYGGFLSQYAVPDIYDAIRATRSCIVFVNTRAQAEMLMQMLWTVNDDSLPITVYHGSLNREQRRRTEAMMAAGKLRAVVATAALELGIDWGDVDLVIQVGAPKGVSRLLQRIGRSNHRMDVPSEALLVPSNRFESLECQAAMNAIARGVLDGDEPVDGSQDVVIQYIVNCACGESIHPDEIFAEVTGTVPYKMLAREDFDRLFRFAVNGGTVLSNYERYLRLRPVEDGRYVAATNMVRRRHRMNIGVIVEAARLKVMKLNKTGKTGRILGEVEEGFAQGLTPGDTFMFAGELLSFARIRDLVVEARPATGGGEPKIPAYAGGNMPLSTFLADGVRHVLSTPSSWRKLPAETREWLRLQQDFSIIPPEDTLLIEHFPRGRLFHTVFYTFEGRLAGQTLGLLLTRRMERQGFKPVSFTVTDYGLAIATLETIPEEEAKALLSPDILGDDLEEWIMDAAMLRRSFRHVAIVAGLAEQQHVGQRSTVRQLTVNTNLIYDVLRRHEPDHILLTVARRDAERELLDLKRLSDMLLRFQGRLLYHGLDRASPLAIPVLTEVRTEQVRGAGVEALLAQASLALDAEQMIEDVRAALA